MFRDVHFQAWNANTFPTPKMGAVTFLLLWLHFFSFIPIPHHHPQPLPYAFS